MKTTYADLTDLTSSRTISRAKAKRRVIIQSLFPRVRKRFINEKRSSDRPSTRSSLILIDAPPERDMPIYR